MSIIFHLIVQKKQLHVASLHLFSANPKGKSPVSTLHVKTFVTTLSLSLDFSVTFATKLLYLLALYQINFR